MMSFVMTFFVTVFALFALIASAPLNVRDVFVPPVLYPCEGTVWKAGSKYTVTWNVSNPPAQITNKIGRVVLAKGDRLIGLAHPLASGFDILLGRIEVEIPANTTTGNDYSVVVFGDSGNNSKRFTITQ